MPFIVIKRGGQNTPVLCAQVQSSLNYFYMYPSFTNYRCILITGVFRFLQMTIARVIELLSFGIFHPTLFTIHFLLSLKKNNAEMSFLNVNDLLLVCIVQNHQNSPLYIIKNMFVLKIKRNQRWKNVSACCGRFWQPDSLRKTKNDVTLCLSTWVTLCPNMAERCRHQNSTFILSCLSTLFWCTLWFGISPK